MEFSLAYAIKEVSKGTKLTERRIERVLELVDDGVLELVDNMNGSANKIYDILKGAAKVPENLLYESEKVISGALGYELKENQKY